MHYSTQVGSYFDLINLMPLPILYGLHKCLSVFVLCKCFLLFMITNLTKVSPFIISYIMKVTVFDHSPKIQFTPFYRKQKDRYLAKRKSDFDVFLRKVFQTKKNFQRRCCHRPRKVYRKRSFTFRKRKSTNLYLDGLVSNVVKYYSLFLL